MLYQEAEVVEAEKEWLSNVDLSEQFDVPLATVRRWRYVGDGPPGVKIGRHVRYHRRDVERWIERKAAEQRAAVP